ncbi:MAG: TolB family protein, partial [Limisphaerales bacterium]
MKPLRLFALLASALAMAMTSLAQLPPLLPRDVLFGNPERTSPALSPDGQRLAWLAPDTNNVLQVWVKTVGQDDDRVVTADKKRGIRQYFWARNNRHLLYLQDSDGDENFHVYGVDLAEGNVRDYSPFQGVRAGVVDLHPDFPDEILLSLNLRDRALFDVHRLNLNTGALLLDTVNPGDVMGWVTDPKFRVRLAQVATADGGTEIRVRADEQTPWKTFLKVGPEEILGALGFTADGQSVFLNSSIGRDTAAVIEKNLASGAEKVVAASDEVDAGEVVIHPRRHVVQAVSFSPGRTSWQVIDPEVNADFEGLAKLNDGDFFVVNRTEAEDLWLVGFHSDRAPGRFYRWDRLAKTGTFLFATRPKLDGL